MARPGPHPGPPVQEDLSAIILAGGAASRLGGEKPLRMLRGKSLVSRAIDLALTLTIDVVVSAGSRVLNLAEGIRTVPDPAEYGSVGPLAGILAGLRAVKGERVVLVACDLPNLTAPLLSTMAAGLGDGSEACYFAAGDMAEPLVAALVVAPAVIAVEQTLQSGMRRVDAAWGRLKARILSDADLAEFAPLERIFRNVNTFSDLEREEAQD